MDFSLTEEQEIFKRSVRRFMEKECPREYARALDENEEYPHELFDKMGEMGWMGLPFPEQYGGGNGGVTELTILLEEMSRVLRAGASIYFATVIFGGETILHFGTDMQKEKYLPLISNGKLKFSLALTEPNAGSDAASLTTSAEKKDGGYILNGSKIFITGAKEANYLIVAARTDKGVPKHKGITLFLVERKSEGITMNRLKKLGVKASDTNMVYLEDVRVEEEMIVGGANKGWDVLLKTLEVERVGLAAESVGLAQIILEDSLRYAKERSQFGRPIGSFQMIKAMVADMQTEIEASRLLTYKAAWMMDKGLPSGITASMAKLFASETCTRCANKGMQIFGGYGYMMEYDMQRYLRDSKVNEIGGGTSEIQRLIIARELGL